MRGYGPDLWIDDATTSILLEPPSDLHVMTDSELDGLADLVEALDKMCRLTGCSPEVVEQAQHRHEESAAVAAKAR